MSTLKDHTRYFPDLIDLTREVVNSLLSRQNPDYKVVGCEQLARKIFLHAATVQHLIQRTPIYIPERDTVDEVLDFSSVMVVTRAILDTYINFFEVFVEPLSDEEYEYRYAVYKVRGFKLREDFLKSSMPHYSLQKEVKHAINDLDRMRNDVQKTKKFASFGDDNHIKQSLEGNIQPSRKPSEKIKAAGFGKRFLMQYAYLSSYVHGDSLSVAQIEQITNTDDIIEPIIITVMTILAKLILDYAKLFSEAKSVYDSADPDLITIVERLVNVAPNI